MSRRLEYILFIAGVLLVSLLAPVILFAVRDRISNRSVYAENQEISISAVLTNNYIEDDALRMATYLANKENGVEYQVVELDSKLTAKEVLTRLHTAFHYDGSAYEMIIGDITSQTNTQYAICNADDASDIMFLVTCITLIQHGGTSDISRLYRILVDSQTGALYFMSVYYANSGYARESKSFNQGIFTGSYWTAYDESLDEFFSVIDGLNDISCFDLLVYFADWYGSDTYNDGDFSISATDSDSSFEVAYYYADLAVGNATMTRSSTTHTTLTMSFPAGTSAGSTDQTVEAVTQFGIGDITSGGLNYECRMCFGIEDFAVWIPRFGYLE